MDIFVFQPYLRNRIQQLSQQSKIIIFQSIISYSYVTLLFWNAGIYNSRLIGLLDYFDGCFFPYAPHNIILQSEIQKLFKAYFFNFICMLCSRRNIPSLYWILRVRFLLILRPLYDFGITSGVLHSCVLQHCDSRLKVLYVLITNCAIIGFFVPFEIAYIQYIVCSFSMFFLLGVQTYIYEDNRRSQFFLSKSVEIQKSILYEFTNDSLFAIMYDENSRSFQLSFANKKFESLYKTDLDENNVKEFLRSQSIINRNNQNSYRSLNNKQINKQINLEEYLFELVQQKLDYFNQDRFLIETNNGKEKYLIDILKFENQKTQFFLSIKENQAKHQIEKYEHIIKDLNENFKSVLMVIGNKFEELYKTLLNLNDHLIIENEILRKSYSNIQFSLNYIKNHLIYLQKGRISFLKQQYETLTIEKLNEALLDYFIYYTQQHRKQFLLNCSYDLELQLITLNSKLLTQLLINIFNKILKLSEPRSCIQLSIDKKQVQQSSINDKNEKTNQDLQIIQFSYIFEHKDQIENIESQFYQSISLDSQKSLEIECIVNRIILKILSPQGSIQIQQEYQQGLSNYKTFLTFSIYTDQTQLDPSFTKYLQQNFDY
ncbi:unnamed protein product (macronuclear) [Paramecium tetraurelia]|uniref:Transmembrane protein n=1 Tax=Paramecium tetraurelia TaxID=5888 RepID=A0D7P9_PARTE|nr:uncharacterized protein GSPATT00014033001 [Paramecium tetraurelia]CAK79066.1 unnamed protein product [Paramecium tetraurelia]|eukprot:XP_001446463.1 hypothetical protein (macronuclear) [Paramecium tetraurelia strain d4-2]